MSKLIKTGNDFCLTMTHYIESMLDKQNYTGMIKYYEDNYNAIINIGTLPAGLMVRNIATAYSFISNHSSALKTIRIAQNLIARSGDSDELAETFILLGNILRKNGELKESEKAFRDAESIFRRNDNIEGQSRALNLLAGLFFRQNDFNNALSILMEAVKIVRKLKDQVKLSYMMGNIGRIYSFTGNFKEAKKHLEINIKLSGELGDKKEAMRASLSLGYVFIQEGNYKQAENILNKAYSTITNMKLIRDEVICLTYLGELFYKSNQLEESHNRLQHALKLAESIEPSSLLTARVWRHLAELAILNNNIHSAQRFTNLAMPIMREQNIKVEIGALWKIKALIEESKKNHQKGEDYFMKSFDYLGESSVKFEKADSLISAGCSSLFNFNKRMTFLFRVEEFYSTNNLNTKLNEIGKIIANNDSETERQKRFNKNISNQNPLVADFITQSNKIKSFKSQLPLICQSDIPLLITGETGVGKDHMVRYFHSLVCPSKPFKAVNCASLPDTLLESELFGYKKGAFTGADKDKDGLFLAANGGLLYLDEIGDMPLILQSKLLKVIESRKIMPLGSTKEISLNAILVFATNRNLEEMVAKGTFRRDLYYRISGINFTIPSLRERKEDIPLLMKHFMQKSSLLDKNRELAPELIHQFVQYNRPGNTRELVNKIKRLEIMAEMVAEGDLVELSRTIFSSKQKEQQESLFKQVEKFEKELLVEALLAADGNKSKAARILGIHEATVRTKLKRYGIMFESCH